MAIPSHPTSPDNARRLIALGSALREVRMRQGVTAVAAAEAAGISRVTLHRIERGEPSVAVGAWIAVAGVLGTTFEIAGVAGDASGGAGLPRRIPLDDYPQLRQLAWQLDGTRDVSPAEALDLYERNWRHVDRAALSLKEAALIHALSTALGGGRLLV